MAIAIGLLKTVLELARAKKSGAVDVEGPSVRVRLFVEDGVVVFANDGTVSETLGRMLVRDKVISEQQYKTALDFMADLRAQGKQTRLGQVLVDLGAISRAQLDAALSAQVRQKVVRALGWTTASFTFIEAHDGGIDIAGRFATPIEPLVVAALRLAPEERVEDLLRQSLSRYPTLRADGTSDGGATRAETLRRVAAFKFPPTDEAIAKSLDGSRTVAEILGSSSDSDPAVILAALLLTDCLDLSATPRAPRKVALPGKAPAIRRKPQAGGARPPLAPPKVALPTRAARSLGAPAPDTKDNALRMKARLAAARQAKQSLPPPAKAKPAAPVDDEAVSDATPQAPMAPVARLLAEQAFQAGKTLVRANQMRDAAVELRKAATLHPALEYELWAEWAAMRAEPGTERRRAEDLEALATRALEQDPSLGFAYFVLGHLALRARDPTRARELFAKARGLDPETTSDAKDVRLRAADSAPRSPTPPKAGPRHATADIGDSREAKPIGEPLAVESTAPPADAGSAKASAAPRGRRRAKLAIVGAAAIAAAAVAWARRANEQARPAATPTGSASSAGSAASATNADRTGSAAASDAALDASDAASAAAAAAQDDTAISLDDEPDASPSAAAADAAVLDDSHGALDFPKGADGHRVFVDGKLVGQPPEPIVVPCGRRLVQVGSNGRERAVDVPCNAQVAVPYP